MNERSIIKTKKRIVVKIGSSSLTHSKTGKINFGKMEKFVRQIVDLKNSDRDVILVTSGAIALGVSALNMRQKPSKIEEKQAVAAVGQASLMTHYQRIFREYNQNVGQVLITKDLLEHYDRKQNAINTFNSLLSMGVIPIVNENDTVATEEIEFGDNDNLSAIVAKLTSSDLLILLSDIDGLYESDPRENTNAKLINLVHNIDDHIESMASGTKSKVGTGGMQTKIQAAKYVTENGIDMVIANSKTDLIIEKIIRGENVGTMFCANNK